MAEHDPISPIDPDRLVRLARPMLTDPPIAPTPVAEIRRRAARRARQRVAALAVAVVVVLAVGGTALARAGREAPVQVGTTPGTGVQVPDLRVWMDNRATPAQIAAVQATLLADPAVVSLVYSDQAAYYGQFRCYFGRQREILESVDPIDLPTQFGLDVVGGAAAAQAVADEVEHAPGVRSVSFRPGLERTSSATIPPEIEAELPPGAATGTMVLHPPPPNCPITGTTLR
jgi:hypothetical protein